MRTGTRKRKPGPSRGTRVAGAALLGVLLLAACSDGGQDTGETAGDDAAGGAETVVEEEPEAPPAFAAEPAATLTEEAFTPPMPAAVLGDAVFLADHTGLTRFDAEGTETGRAEPEHPVIHIPDTIPEDSLDQAQAGVRSVQTPLAGELNGDPVVFSGFPVELPAGEGLEIIAADADTGERVWNTSFAPEKWGTAPPRVSASTSLLGYHDDLLILQIVKDRMMSSTYAVSVPDAAVAWSDTDAHFSLAVHEDVIIARQIVDGGLMGPLTGLSPVDGSVVWRKADDDTNGGAGFGPVLRVGLPDGLKSALVSAADGSVLVTDEDGLPTGSPHCVHDRAADIVVCGADSGAVAVAVDADGTVLWSLSRDDDGWSGVPTGTDEGIVFVDRGEDAPPVAVNAADGEVVNEDSGVAPALFGSGFGVVRDGPVLTLHPRAD
ncbi:PQQ-binding-like beta-propeller repeat protein [Streptomyces sp. ST2-7A]|uniref:outer membrane protein assembly factor BamB family protein n=1 Tax=Streptomyces sp. ST2-7A TaxID=2907214 RepID=UPI001F1D06F4|nr:PQQ-binding-like beta-propeller repeat protein [Streptomyces sp. ST2-7A]MCE7078679.1 PQQ-like beta-propeller repeat protein [Streptomyces sp. ST2-7A]